MSCQNVVRTWNTWNTSCEGNRMKKEETFYTQYANGQIKSETKVTYSDGPSCGQIRYSNECGANSSMSNGSSCSRSVQPTSNSQSTYSGQFEQDALERHNEYRRKHGVPLLELSDELNAYAKQWADNLAATETFLHRPHNNYGENLYCKYGTGNFDCSAADAVDAWYEECKYFTYGYSSFSAQTGHFTQVVWKSTKRVGIAKSRSRSGKIYVVANYDPPGNYMNQFNQNVLPPKY